MFLMDELKDPLCLYDRRKVSMHRSPLAKNARLKKKHCDLVGCEIVLEF